MRLIARGGLALVTICADRPEDPTFLVLRLVRDPRMMRGCAKKLLSTMQARLWPRQLKGMPVFAAAARPGSFPPQCLTTMLRGANYEHSAGVTQI